MAWGISPKTTATVPLGDFPSDKYLTIVFNAFQNLNWKVSYADDQGLIAYTPISWASYSEEITVVLKNDIAYLKSECVGYQGFLYDYGKNETNLELLIAEIEYAAFHIKDDEAANIQKFKDNLYQHKGINLDYTPLGAKTKLTHLGSIFVPKANYKIVPWLIIINCLVFIIQRVLFLIYGLAIQFKGLEIVEASKQKVKFYHTISLGVERNLVLNGEYWRLIAACFSHVSLPHLLSNMIFLAYIGSIIEGRVGKWNFLGLYITTGICASLTSIGFRYEGVGVGASGAIMGLFGIFLAYLSTNFFDKKARTALLISTLIITLYILYPKDGRVDNAAHSGGFISGYILGLFSYLAYIQPMEKKKYLVRFLSYVLVFIIAISSLVFIPKYDLPKYRASKQDLVDNLNKISTYFYSPEYVNFSKAERIKLLEEKMLPVIKKNRGLLKDFKEVPIPKEEQKEANKYYVFIAGRLEIYELLYKEYKTGNKKYRIKMEKLNDDLQNLNQLEE